MSGGRTFQKCKITQLYLHGASLVIAYQRRPPLNGDGFWQRHGAVRLISGKVLQAAGVCLFLSVLGENMRREKEKCLLLSIKTKTHGRRCYRGSTCRATSAEAGLNPKPVGAFSSSSTPLTPGLKWSSTWKRSSDERSCEEMQQSISREGKQTVVDKSFKSTFKMKKEPYCCPHRAW